MQIPVKIAGKDEIGEWMMLELQGDLESRTQAELCNKFIGDLHFSKQGIPILIIGHHLLYGKVQVLNKPIAVMRKTRIASETSRDMDVDDQEDLQASGSAQLPRIEYTIKAIVRKKLLFKARPKPIIASMQNPN